GAGLSLAITFCRGRTHDDYYYDRPEVITGEAPPPPYIDLRSEPILRRVLIKEALRQAFAACVPGSDDPAARPDSVHGEFGRFDDWAANSAAVQAWLIDMGNEAALR